MKQLYKKVYLCTTLYNLRNCPLVVTLFGLQKTVFTFKNVILTMGEFHTTCNLLSTIGKRFQDAGLRDLCVQSGVSAEVSIVMEGRKYNRAVRRHNIVYEAMMRLAWNGFLLWIHANH